MVAEMELELTPAKVPMPGFMVQEMAERWTVQRFAEAGTPKPNWIIGDFEGPYYWLSNFAHSLVVFEGQEYPTVEHAYQAAKTLSSAERDRIRQAVTPHEAKTLGREATLRPDWEDVKTSVMAELLDQKFGNSTLGFLLIATSDAYLVEGNWWGDEFWGVCDGRGQNMLGLALMSLRDELRQSRSLQNLLPIDEG